jgi:hypothetical protein
MWQAACFYLHCKPVDVTTVLLNFPVLNNNCIYLLNPKRFETKGGEFHKVHSLGEARIAQSV